MQAIGIAFSVLGVLQQGAASASASRYNRDLANRRAAISKQQASADADKKRRDTVRRLGGMRAAYGASGVTLEGSPLDIMAESAANAEHDALTIEYKGDLEAAGYGAEASLENSRAKQATAGAVFGAGATLLTAVSKYYRDSE